MRFLKFKNALGIFATLFVLVFMFFGSYLQVMGATIVGCNPNDRTIVCEGYVPLAPIGSNSTTLACTDGQGNPIECTNLSTYLTGIFRVGIAVAGALAFLMIVLGGFQYLSTDAMTGKEEGKERITRAIGGLVLALVSYIILYTINPQLVALNLNFGPRANSAPSIARPTDLNQRLTAQQLAALRTSATARNTEIQARVNALRQEATDLENQANQLPPGSSDRTALLNEVAEKRRQASELDLQRVVVGEERLASAVASNATSANLGTAIAEAGGSVTRIHDAFAEARTAFASNPEKLYEMTSEEMNRVTTIRKSTAFGIIQNPPLINPNDPRTSVSVDGTETGPVASGYVNQNALNTQVDQQMANILAERDAQLTHLRALNARPPDSGSGSGSGISSAQIATRMAQINATANQNICQIKNQCHDYGYNCQSLRPNIRCN